ECDGGVPSNPPKAKGTSCGAGADEEPLTCDGNGLCVAPVCAGDLGFPVPPRAPVGVQPLALAVADLNGDGKTDAAVVNAADGDGIPDLAVTHYTCDQQGCSGGVAVLVNQGDGTLLPPVDYDLGTNVVAVTAADVDGDGNPELVVANSDDDSVGVLKNLGNGV